MGKGLNVCRLLFRKMGKDLNICHLLFNKIGKDLNVCHLLFVLDLFPLCMKNMMYLLTFALYIYKSTVKLWCLELVRGRITWMTQTGLKVLSIFLLFLNIK